MTEKLLSNIQTGFDDIKENYLRITEKIEKAKAAANRSDTVRLMAVTKTVDCGRVNCAIKLGIDLLGENRVQEFLEKKDGYDAAEVHFIGSLQTNKVKYIIDKVTMIHSVDSMRLAEEISRRAAASGKKMDVLAEINIGGEETKGGIPPENVKSFCSDISALPGIRLRGLMAIPPRGCQESCFAEMNDLYIAVKENSPEGALIDTLSMGMSGDFETAVKHGATIVRIGSGLFGYRIYNIRK